MKLNLKSLGVGLVALLQSTTTGCDLAKTGEASPLSKKVAADTLSGGIFCPEVPGFCVGGYYGVGDEMIWVNLKDNKEFFESSFDPSEVFYGVEFYGVKEGNTFYPKRAVLPGEKFNPVY